MVLLQRKLILFQVSREGQHFHVGSNFFFQGGGGKVQMLISLETNITCDFPRGGGGGGGS